MSSRSGGNALVQPVLVSIVVAGTAISLFDVTYDDYRSATELIAITIGILGAIAGPAALNLLRIRDRQARGLAVGAVSHGIGASRMIREDESEGAFVGLSMGLTALAISLLVPLLALWLW